MSEGLQFIDLIFYAMIAVFLVLRLRSVLGRRNGEERRRRSPFDRAERQDGPKEEPKHEADNVIDLPSRTILSSAAAEAALVRVQIADQHFNINEFLHGAQSAFEIIIGAFAREEKDVLRPLLSDAVFDNFCRALKTRAEAGESVETQLLGPPTVEITDVKVQGRVAFVVVRFLSEQVNIVRDRDGRVIEGDPNLVNRVVDVWTFAREMQSSDPNWTLVETRSGD
ncbi:MAG: hypothetical protein FD153_332 [Rhodospirillaceae bacterium]|nr:MAG: hypothetical protein FD153_332 [Rhodospirillaceae bacterium]